MLTLSHIVESLAGVPLNSRQAIRKVVIDSRDAESGALFVALPGETSDGHDFVGNAFSGGAIAALALPC